MTPEEWVIWSYRLFLGREPEDSATIQNHIGPDFSPEDVRRKFMESEEFKSVSSLHSLVVNPQDTELRRLKARFAVAPKPGQAGFFTDFLGVRTRCSYLPQTYAAYSGAVEQRDGTGAVPLHEAAEVVALLRSVVEAKGRLVVVELGAGWGPWLVAGACAARSMGLPSTLVGVEGDAHHFDFMRTHMRDNGIDPEAGNILHCAVIGAQDGMALFPVLPDPSGDWGAEAVFADGPASTRPAGETKYVEVPCMTVNAVLQPLDRVDVMHCDIQGAEADALEIASDALDAKVRRIVIGTHGRAIEERLMHLFPRRNWILEFEQACTFAEQPGRLVLSADGVQVWRNNALAG